MQSTNVKIIRELKNFIEDTASNEFQRQIYTIGSSAFSRKRILTFKILILLLLNALKRSLSVELQDFFDHLNTGYSCSKQAFSKQRGKLSALFFHDWNRVLVNSFYQYGLENEVKKWKGMILWALDGSSIALPDTEEIRDKFGFVTGTKSGAGIPVARICGLYDVLNHLYIKGFLHPYRVSEESVVMDCLEGLNISGKLLLFDRGYPSYWLMYALTERTARFVMRVSSNANNSVKAFIASKSVDRTLDIYPPYSSLKKLREMGVEISKDTPLKVRMVKVLLETGETEILVTNLFDKTVYTRADLKQVYYLRWGIETAYGYIKEELQLAQFSGIRSICIEQDFAANLFLSNLQNLIERQCDPYLQAVNRKRKYNYKVNKNVCWASIKQRIVKLFLFQDVHIILSELQCLFEKHLEPIRPGRKYTRIKKRQPSSKHYNLKNYKRAI